MKKSAVYSFLCAVSACTFLFSTGMTYASWKVQDDTINKITMGSVRGQIVEEFAQDTIVYPDADMTKIVQVKNTGTIDAIPRVKIEKVWGDSRDENGNLLVNPALSTENIEITYNTEDWSYNSDDGYFYYKSILSPDEVTNSLFDSFRINGEKSGKEYQNKFADIIVTMEIIQAAGDSLSYWDMSYDDLGISYKQDEQQKVVTSVTFQNPENGFTFDVNGGDLFADFKNLIPGESRSQIVEITNIWDYDVEIYFWADYVDQENADSKTMELVNQLLHQYANIIITNENGVVIYDGPIWGNVDKDIYGTDSMKFPYSLGKFSSGETKNVNISLYLSPEMDNEYLDLLGLIKWVFSAEGEPAPTETTTENIQTSPTETTSEPIQTNTTTVTTEKEPIQTSTINVDVGGGEETRTSTTVTNLVQSAEQTDTTTSVVSSGGETIQTTMTTRVSDDGTAQTNSTTETVQTNTETTGSSSSTDSSSTKNKETSATDKSVSTSTMVRKPSGTITNTDYDSPKTGDNFNLKFYLSLMIGSLIMLPITFKKSKEK